METPSLVAGIVLLSGALGYYFYTNRKKTSKLSMDSNAILQDLTALASEGKLDPVIGVDEATERIFHVLARKQKNNILLLGEPGVGKTAIVEGLAQMIVSHRAPKKFQDKKIVALNLADLLSGTKYRGELESKIRRVLDDLTSESRQNILFIDEIHMLEQARGSEGALDVADILKPALARGDLHVIGATTWAEYQKFIKNDAALERRFQPIMIQEPSRENAIRILMGVKGEYESFHGVRIPEETVVTAVDSSIHFIKNRFLPDKAFDLIDEACAKISIETSAQYHATSLGIVHAASKKVKETDMTEVPVVSPKDVEDIALEWQGGLIK